MKKYQTEEERLEAKRQYMKKYYKANKEKRAEYYKQWYQTNRESVLEQQKEYNRTPMRRASKLVSAHNQEDKKYNRGECTLTAQWIVDNIFTRKCVYCGESDWRKLGCDRIDNSKPHTEDNVVCCCGDCNKKRGTKEFVEYFGNPL